MQLGHTGVLRISWVLDVAFSEDQARMRVDHAAENMAVVRNIALNAVKKETTINIGVAN
jgi:predicted transposase YbfD/YdcC